MINFDEITGKKQSEPNPKYPYIPDSPYRILISKPLYQEKQMHYLI